MDERWSAIRHWVEKIAGASALGKRVKRLVAGRNSASVQTNPVQPSPSRVNGTSDHTAQSLGILFYASPIAICVSTLTDGRITTVNDSFLQMTDYRREEVIGCTIEELALWANPDERAKFVDLLHANGAIRDVYFTRA